MTDTSVQKLETFTNDQAEAFLAWSEDHERDGYVLTAGTIHTDPRCPHLVVPWKNHPTYRLIGHPRRCSTDLAELVRLAESERGAPRYCRTCDRTS